MRKINRLPEAIQNLEKARELNPTHLPIYNELGRAYTFIGEYEKADEKFNEALKGEKYPNYRHMLMTLQYLADNYKRWAEAFGIRYDLNGQLKMLAMRMKLFSKHWTSNQQTENSGNYTGIFARIMPS